MEKRMTTANFVNAALKRDDLPLPKERLCEIGMIALLHHLFIKNEITLGADIRREFGQFVKYMDIDPSEAAKFVAFMVDTLSKATIFHIDNDKTDKVVEKTA